MQQQYYDFSVSALSGFPQAELDILDRLELSEHSAKTHSLKEKCKVLQKSILEGQQTYDCLEQTISELRTNMKASFCEESTTAALVDLLGYQRLFAAQSTTNEQNRQKLIKREAKLKALLENPLKVWNEKQLQLQSRIDHETKLSASIGNRIATLQQMFSAFVDTLNTAIDQTLARQFINQYHLQLAEAQVAHDLCQERLACLNFEWEQIEAKIKSWGEISLQRVSKTELYEMSCKAIPFQIYSSYFEGLVLHLHVKTPDQPCRFMAYTPGTGEFPRFGTFGLVYILAIPDKTCHQQNHSDLKINLSLKNWHLSSLRCIDIYKISPHTYEGKELVRTIFPKQLPHEI